MRPDPSTMFSPGGSRVARYFVARNLVVLLAAGAIALGCSPGTKTADDSNGKAGGELSASKPWTGDFDGMFERRQVRMLVPYSRTLYYLENGEAHGLTADLAKDFETYLNAKHADQLGGRPIAVTLIPTTRDKLLSGLVDGMGDISGGNLTETPTRTQTADFVAQTERDPALEVLVSGPGAPAVATLEALSGKSVNVRQSSSYLESLNALNEKLGAASKPAVKIVAMPDALEDEDLLDMLNAGLFDFTVVDSWKAKLWAQTAPKIKVHDGIALRTGGTIGWAIRKQSPKLRAELDGFYKTASQQGLMVARLANYEEKLREISGSSGGVARNRFDQTLALFRKHGGQYGFDGLMLAAEGIQESQLAQMAAGHPAPGPGAPATVPSGAELEKNAAAGTKYRDQLIAQYFPDAKFSDDDRALFTFASWRAGPDNISNMRKEAANRGLDPNQWFNNVELVTSEKLGIETTAYVRNILKYQVASKLIAEAGQGR